MHCASAAGIPIVGVEPVPARQGGTRTTAAFKFYNNGSTPFHKCVTFQGDAQGKCKFAHINEIMDVNKDTKECKNN